VGVVRSVWEKAWGDAAREQQGADWMAFEADPQLADRAHQLAREKYSQSRYNQKR